MPPSAAAPPPPPEKKATKKRPRAALLLPPKLLYVEKASTTTGSSLDTPQRRQQQQHHPVLLVAGPRRAGMLLGVPYSSLLPLHGPDEEEEKDDEARLADDDHGGDAGGEADPRTTTTEEVALMSTPSDAPFDHQVIRRLQLHFVGLAILGVVMGGVLLAHPQAMMDPSLVLDGPAAAAALEGSGVAGRDWTPLPGPFDRVTPAAFRAYVPVYVVSVLLAGWGVAAALLALPLGLKVYSLAAFLHVLHAALFAPYLVYVPCLLPTAVMIFVAEKLYNRLVPTWLLVPGMWRRL